jgi:hypothetical protein
MAARFLEMHYQFKKALGGNHDEAGNLFGPVLFDTGRKSVIAQTVN